MGTNAGTAGGGMQAGERVERLRRVRDQVEGHLRQGRVLLELLDSLLAEGEPTPVRPEGPEPTPQERLWLCPAETRLGVDEAAAALGRSKHWAYRAYRGDLQGLNRPLPFSRFLGTLTITAHDLREWLQGEEAAGRPLRPSRIPNPNHHQKRGTAA